VAPLRLGGLRGKQSTPSDWLGGTGVVSTVGERERLPFYSHDSIPGINRHLQLDSYQISYSRPLDKERQSCLISFLFIFIQQMGLSNCLV
jgi:hypothetical protein